ncbi:upstream stimulatory factor 1 isoform X1 [Lates japonicus]|uniref:Upstream stimulatory factor 1 isoform X1 n=1 Tax=Lates japonicus TaxID=270547 RepID=A0AAD3M618_LATJO|nr:upstream stimulatory factor 1 isoform X1 [Lates japonicus]
MVQKSDVISLEEVLCQAGIVNCSVVLLKNPVITTQTMTCSHEGCPLQHLHIASCCLTPLHNLKLHCSIEGKSPPDHDGAPSTVPCRKHLRWDLLVMPVTLEAIRTVKMPSNGYGTAVGTSDKLNLGRGSSCVLTDSQLDPPAQGW